MDQAKRLIPNRLRRHRKIFGYKLKEVAFLIGIKNPADIAQWEKGVKLPTAINLLKLSIIYRTFPNALYDEFMRNLKEEIIVKESRLVKKG
jgi:transcriptional regulator with XRE-family HTH domain